MKEEQENEGYAARNAFGHQTFRHIIYSIDGVELKETVEEKYDTKTQYCRSVVSQNKRASFGGIIKPLPQDCRQL